MLFRAVFLVDIVRYNRIIRMMSLHSEALRHIFEIVGEMDAAISIASFRKSLPHVTKPTFQEENAVEFDEIYHPLIQDPVVNSGTLMNDSIITGSNASGKSTFIKAVAVNQILAHTIHTVCARKYQTKRFYVASSMAIRDDILTGESYFITEIKSLKRIIDYSKERSCICLIDEILRGTNTPERIAASTAVLRVLHKADSLCLIASHDIELTEILKSEYDNFHFTEHFVEGVIGFDYKLRKGPLDEYQCNPTSRVYGL